MLKEEIKIMLNNCVGLYLHSAKEIILITFQLLKKVDLPDLGPDSACLLGRLKILFYSAVCEKN